jgi:hypothetical protein
MLTIAMPNVPTASAEDASVADGALGAGTSQSEASQTGSGAEDTTPESAHALNADVPDRNDKALMVKRLEDGIYTYTAEADATGLVVVGATWGNEDARESHKDSVATSSNAGRVEVGTQEGKGTEDGNITWKDIEWQADASDAASLAIDPVIVNANGFVRLTLKTASDLGDVQLVIIQEQATQKDVEVTAAEAKVQALGVGVHPLNGGVYPGIHSRYEWGADDSAMQRHAAPPSDSNYGEVDGGWPRMTTYRGAIVHHTAGSNAYGPADVPGIIRGVFNYHAESQGWGDIGYNFLVDKYGGIWEGRYGSIANTPIGYHAKKNANLTTFGVSVLGNYDTAGTTGPMIDALVNVISWKFNALHIDPHGWANIGTERGTEWKPTIVGHRDVGPTACPGANLYAQLQNIRNATNINPGRPPIGNLDNVSKVDGTHIRVQGWAADPDILGESINVHIYLGARVGGGTPTQVVSVPANVARPDVASALGSGKNTYGFDTTITVNNAEYQSVFAYGINHPYTGGDNAFLGADGVSMLEGKVPVFRMVLNGMNFFTQSRGEYKNVAKSGATPVGVVMLGMQDTEAGTPIFRLLNGAGYHFFTSSGSERDGLVRSGWRLEGVAWTADPTKTIYRIVGPGHYYTTSLAEAANALASGSWRYEGKMIDGHEESRAPLSTNPAKQSYPIYRINNGADHMFTKNESEVLSAAQGAHYRYEGIAFWGVDDDGGDMPVYRLAGFGEHFYTTSAYERDNAVRGGYRYEGIGWYLDDSTTLYRVISNEHFYTASIAEVISTTRSGWRYEGAINYPPSDHTPVYRMVLPSGNYFYTTNFNELLNVCGGSSTRYEGVGWYTDNTGDKPVYRLVLPSGEHLFTANEGERDGLRSAGARYEGVGWRYTDAENKPVYRLVLPGGRHIWTASSGERDNITAGGGRLEGDAFSHV